MVARCHQGGCGSGSTGTYRAAASVQCGRLLRPVAPGTAPGFGSCQRFGLFPPQEEPELRERNRSVARFKSAGLVRTCPHGQWDVSSAEPPAACGKLLGHLRVCVHTSVPSWWAARCQDICPALLVLGRVSPLLLDGEVRGSGTAWQQASGGQRHCAPGVFAWPLSPETRDGRTDPLVLRQASAWRTYLGAGVAPPRRADAVFQQAPEMLDPSYLLCSSIPLSQSGWR